MNVYRITYEHYESNCLTTKTKFIEANCLGNAQSYLYHMYDTFEPKAIIYDIISCERVAKDVIHTDKK